MFGPDDPPATPELSLGRLDDLSRLIDGLNQLDQVLRLPSADEAEGDVRLGRFRLRRRLGAGRYGVVFAADDPVLGRRVVVKVPQPAVLADPDQRARFVREAQAAGRLDHPGVVPVYDAGEDRGLAYMAAGLVVGPTLAAWLADRRTPPDPATAARLVELLARAVHHAHERGVLHCDLKPANILIDPSADPADAVPGVGAPRVTDFGMARLLEGDPSLTRTFQVAGTLLYMAPEQARGDRRALTSRADVYALGAVLYELLTGRPPFAGESESEVRRRVLSDPPADPAQVRPGAPRDVAAVCLKCLEKDAARRYASAAELADDLRRFLSGRPVLARRPGVAERAVRVARRNPLVTLFGGIAVALGLALVGLLARFGYARLEHEVSLKEAERTVAVERFHARLAAVRARRTEPYSGWGTDALADLRELAGMAPAADHLAELRSEAVAALAALDLRPLRSIGDGFPAYCQVYSPDGTVLAVGGWRAGPAGTGRVRLYNPGTGDLLRELPFSLDAHWDPEKDRPDGCRSIEYSPDGRWLLVGTRAGRLVRWDLRDPAAGPVVWTGHAADGLPPADRAVSALVFADGGRVLYSAGVTIRRWAIANKWRPIGRGIRAAAPRGTRSFGQDPMIQINGPSGGAEMARFGPGDSTPDPFGLTMGGGMFAIAPDGRLAAVESRSGRELSLAAITRGESPQPFLSSGRPRNYRFDVFDIEFGPDAAILATAGEHDRRVRLWDVVGGALAADRVVGEGSGRLAFAPDGRTLAVSQDECVMLYELTGQVRGAVGTGPWGYLGAFGATPDGAVVATFHGDPSGITEVCRWSVTGDRPPVRADYFTNPPYLTKGNVADISPDGRTVAFVQLDQTNERVIAVPGGVMPTARVSELRFGPDGRLWAADAHRVRVWTLPGWAEERPLENDPGAVAAGAVFRTVAPGRSLTLVGRRDGRVYRLPGPSTVWELFSDPVTALALSADESRAVVGSESGKVVVLDLSAEVSTPIPAAHRDAVRSAAFGPGGWFVIGSADGTIKFWAADRSPLFTIRAGGSVQKLAVSTDGAYLTVLVEGERAVRRWRLDLLRAELAELGLGGGGW